MTTIKVSPKVFDALHHAGLLVELPPSAGCPWRTWGVGTEDDSGDVVCTLIDGENLETVPATEIKRLTGEN